MGDGGRPPAVTVALHIGPGPHRVGAPVAVGVEVTNVGPVPVWMPGVLDGSETTTRRPYYRPSVFRGNQLVAGPPIPEDPLVGPLRPEDLRQLDPGDSFDPTDRSSGAAWLPLSTFATFRPDRPGTYRYSLLVDTTGTEEQWMGRFGQQQYRDRVLPLLARVPKVVLTAAVDVDVDQ